jgi:hypothetical protein
MRRTICLAVLCIAGLATGAWAEHAKVTLEVESGGKKETAFVDQTPPPSGKNPRPVLKVKAGEPIKFQWILTNVYPNKTIEGVTVHFFVARQETVGQKDLPDLNSQEPVLETAFDMDFKPGAKAGARGTLKIEKPGVYLVRLETIQTKSDHEHFSALDLVVEE